MKTTSTWGDTISAHTRFTRSCAMKLLKDEEQAKDLAQDVLIRAFQAEAQFEIGTNLKGWLWSLTYNLFASQYRRNTKFHKIEQASDWLYEGYDCLGVSVNEGQHTHDAELIDQAINGLGDRFEVMRLRMEGMKYSEIAEETGIKLGTVRSLIRRARIELAPLFSMDFIEMKQELLPPVVTTSGPKVRARLGIHAYTLVLEWMRENLSNKSGRVIDRLYLSKTLGTPDWAIQNALPVLVEHGYLIDTTPNLRKFKLYRKTATLEDLEPEKLNRMTLDKLTKQRQ